MCEHVLVMEIIPKKSNESVKEEHSLIQSEDIMPMTNSADTILF